MTDALVGSQVRLDYDDQNESFASYLPVEGTVTRRCKASTGPTDWYLVALERPIDYQHQIGPHYQFKRLMIPQVLIRSRWANEPLGPDSDASVFLVLVSDDQDIPQGPLDIEAYMHVCWARCRVQHAA